MFSDRLDMNVSHPIWNFQLVKRCINELWFWYELFLLAVGQQQNVTLPWAPARAQLLDIRGAVSDNGSVLALLLLLLH